MKNSHTVLAFAVLSTSLMGPVTLAQDHHDNHACVEHKEYVGFCLLIGRKTSYPVIIAIRYQSLISLKPDPRNPALTTRNRFSR
jgi:hypothetical protein